MSSPIAEPQTIKGFIAARRTTIEAEIEKLKPAEERIAVLRRELNDIMIASVALEQGVRKHRASGSRGDDTIQGRILQVLADRQSGMTSADIVTLINQRFGENYASTSVRPQLSRLAQRGELWRDNRRWGLPTARATDMPDSPA